MSYRLARFPLTDKRLREGRHRRRNAQAKRFRFSHFDPKTREPIFQNQIGERYTQSNLLKMFGIQLPIPKHMKGKRYATAPVVEI